MQAIIDWEIWSRSDPRLDLSWLLFFTEESWSPTGAGRDGLRHAQRPGRSALYESETGSTVPNLDWFHALTRYKEAAAMALIAKLAVRRGQGDMIREWADMVPGLVADAYRASAEPPRGPAVRERATAVRCPCRLRRGCSAPCSRRSTEKLGERLGGAMVASLVNFLVALTFVVVALALRPNTRHLLRNLPRLVGSLVDADGRLRRRDRRGRRHRVGRDDRRRGVLGSVLRRADRVRPARRRPRDRTPRPPSHHHSAAAGRRAGGRRRDRGPGRAAGRRPRPWPGRVQRRGRRGGGVSVRVQRSHHRDDRRPDHRHVGQRRRWDGGAGRHRRLHRRHGQPRSTRVALRAMALHGRGVRRDDRALPRGRHRAPRRAPADLGDARRAAGAPPSSSTGSWNRSAPRSGSSSGRS